MAQKVFPNINVVQDVWHFLMRCVTSRLYDCHGMLTMFAIRYLVCVKDGTKNPYRSEVANDIVEALLKARAANGVPAVYRPQAEQEEQLIEVYEKWKEHGGVWTEAAAKVRMALVVCLCSFPSLLPPAGTH